MSYRPNDSGGGIMPTGDGRYRSATPEEVELYDEGSIKAVGGATVASAQQTIGVLQMMGGWLQESVMMQTAGQADMIGNTQLAEQLRHEAPMARDNMIEAGGERVMAGVQAMDTYDKMFPGAADTGRVINAIGTAAITGDIPLAAIAKRGAVGMGARYARDKVMGVDTLPKPRSAGQRVDVLRDGTEIPLRPDEMGRDDLARLGVVGDHYQRNDRTGFNAGAMAVDSMIALKKVPGMQDMMNGVLKFVGQKRPLNKTQAEIIERGLDKRLGHELLPGAPEGNMILSELVRSQPFMADAYGQVLDNNYNNYADKLMKSLGLNGQFEGRGSIQAYHQEAQAVYDATANKIGAVRLDPEDRMVRDGLNAMDAYSRDEFESLIDADGMLNVDGSQLMEMRSKMNEFAAERARDNAMTAATQIWKSVDRIDDVISKRLSGPELKQYKDQLQKHRISLALEKSMTSQNDVSFKRMNSELMKYFQTEYKLTNWAPRGGKITDEMADFLDLNKVVSNFQDLLPDSGTATRMAFGELFTPTGMKRFAMQRVGAKVLADAVLYGNPEKVAWSEAEQAAGQAAQDAAWAAARGGAATQ
jgi:hypothetical protein